MGAAASSGINTQGLTLDVLMQEVNQLLSKVAQVISQTVELEIGELRDLQERTGTEVASTYAAIQDKLAELSRNSEEAQACVRRKEAELESIQLKMKNSVLECYGKYNETVEKMRPERRTIHEEAKNCRLEAQRIIENCMASQNRLECFQEGLAELAKKADDLFKKCQAHIKREIEIQTKSTKVLLDCNKRAMGQANKSFNRIIKEVKKCGENRTNSVST